jgi:pimeloyl-ACP methyl ester carboxylesterase
MKHLFRRILFVGFIAVVILNWTWGRLPAEPEPPAGSKYATVAATKCASEANPEATAKIHYVETPGKGPGVIMIHGHPGTYLDWSYVQAKLQGLRTVSIDRPGYGYSSGGYIAFDRQVEAVHTLARQLGMKKPVIAGHSYGGAIALAYAERYPQETKAIVPVDPGIQSDYPQALDMVQAQFIKATNVPIVRQILNATVGQAMLTATSGPQVKQAFDPDPTNPDYTEQLKAVNLKSSDLKTFADETLNADDLDAFREHYSSIIAPAWVVQGKEDKLVPIADVTAMVKQLSNVHYLQLPGGHMQTWVHPDQVARAIRSAARG